MSLPRRCLGLGLLFAVLLTAATPAWAEGVSVLFVGNSYTYVNDLPKMLQNVIAGSGREAPRVKMRAVGGQTLAGFCQDATLLPLLAEEHTVAVLQEQSQIPALAETDPSVRRQFLQSGQWLVNRIKSAHPKTRIILYETWARHPSLWQHPPDRAMGASPDQMQVRLTRWYGEAAKECGATVAPVGQAWQLNYHREHPLRLHAEDGSHPNFAGTYLAALVLAKTLYGHQLTTTFRGPLSEAEAADLQALAAAVTVRP